MVDSGLLVKWSFVGMKTVSFFRGQRLLPLSLCLCLTSHTELDIQKLRQPFPSIAPHLCPVLYIFPRNPKPEHLALYKLFTHLRLGLPTGLFSGDWHVKVLKRVLSFTILVTCLAHLRLLDVRIWTTLLQFGYFVITS